MNETPKNTNQETTQEAKQELTCPLCRTPLIGEAIAAGKCQCCGQRFDPEDLRKAQYG